MRKVHRINSEGFYLEDVLLKDNEPIPSNCVTVPLPEGIFLPAQFKDNQWLTVLTQEEIQSLMQPNDEIVVDTILQKQEEIREGV